jgi:DNA polymerase
LARLKTRLELDTGSGVEFLALTREEKDRLVREVAAVSANRSESRPGPVHGKLARPASPTALEPRAAHARPQTAAIAPTPSAKPASPTVDKRSVRPPVWTGFSLVPFVEPFDRPERRLALADLAASAQICDKCRLCEKRRTVAWGEGDLAAAVMFVGEGPGRDEDEQGRPFVGRSGRLLTDIIEKGMRVERRGVYITNVVKCRPPGNRDPREDELAACRPYLDRQIEVIKPKALVAVGGVAGCALLGLQPKTGGLRGRWHEYAGIPLRVIYHPSYLLRQRAHDDDRTDADRATWHDIQDVMRLVGGDGK